MKRSNLMFPFLVAFLLAAGGRMAAADPPPDTLKLFKAQCANCHGLDGKGQTTVGKKNGVKDWTDGKTLKTYTNDQIKKLLAEGNKGKDGKQKMPAFKKLTPAQIDALIQFVRSFDHK